MNNNDEVTLIHLEDIIPNRFQPREVFDERALKELAVSIKEHGVIQPIIVRNVNGKYEIIAGERRYKASALAGLTKIPAIIRNLDDKESSKVALLENLQRKNLNPIEEARTYQKILEIDDLSQVELARTMGKSQSSVANKIRLLSLPEEIQEAILQEKISERHARALLNIDDKEKQMNMLNKIIETKMSVRQLEEEIKSMKEDNIETNNNEINNDISINNFVSESPLNPTNNIKDEDDEYGQVKIVPPEEEISDENPPRFLNYGEIDDDEDEDEDATPIGGVENQDINVNEIKNNSIDLNTNDGASDLDNLLNIGTPSSIDTNNYITPAEKIVKADELEEPTSAEDYFKKPDLNAINIPNTTIIENNEPTAETAKEKIKELVEELKQEGINISSDEMNFNQSYQIIIKIDKN